LRKITGATVSRALAASELKIKHSLDSKARGAAMDLAVQAKAKQYQSIYNDMLDIVPKKKKK
jgi:hypothetical protein